MDDRLSRYVTNLDREVFALRDLPEEVIAVLFAYYSRSRDDLRTNLRRLLDDAELDAMVRDRIGTWGAEFSMESVLWTEETS